MLFVPSIGSKLVGAGMSRVPRFNGICFSSIVDLAGNPRLLST